MPTRRKQTEPAVRMGAWAALVAAACLALARPGAHTGLATILQLLAACAFVASGVGLGAGMHHRRAPLAGALTSHAATLAAAALVMSLYVRFGALDANAATPEGLVLRPLLDLVLALPLALFVGAVAVGAARGGLLPRPLRALGWVAIVALFLPMAGAITPAPPDTGWTRFVFIGWLALLGTWLVVGGERAPGIPAEAAPAGEAGGDAAEREPQPPAEEEPTDPPRDDGDP